jgi:hypothetical protein
MKVTEAGRGSGLLSSSSPAIRLWEAVGERAHAAFSIGEAAFSEGGGGGGFAAVGSGTFVDRVATGALSGGVVAALLEDVGEKAFAAFAVDEAGSAGGGGVSVRGGSGAFVACVATGRVSSGSVVAGSVTSFMVDDCGDTSGGGVFAVVDSGAFVASPLTERVSPSKCFAGNGASFIIDGFAGTSEDGLFAVVG